MKRNKLFNPDGDKDFNRRSLIHGNTTNLFELNNIKYEWAMKLYRAFLANFWIPEEIPLGNDSKDYKKLSKGELEAYDKVISFLVFLDSLQTSNLPTFAKYITAPEVNLCLQVQAFQEGVHSHSYGYILDTVVSSTKRDKIYNFWRDDEVLKKRNMLITSYYEDFENNPNEDNFILAILANYLLEGLYFYSGFAFFYTLARQDKMNGTAQVIRYINKDELTHLVLFQNIIQTLQKENPELFNEKRMSKMTQLITDAVESEIKWGQYVISGGVLGLTDDIIEKYIKYLANQRMKAINFKEPYPDYKVHPIKWVDTFATVNEIKTDFFEAKPTSYSKASSLNWDDFDDF